MKKRIEENIRVEVWPGSDRFWYSQEELRLLCEGIIADIRRHVDNIANCNIIFDVRDVCEFCGADWQVNEDPHDTYFVLGEPKCCDRARKEFKKG